MLIYQDIILGIILILLYIIGLKGIHRINSIESLFSEPLLYGTGGAFLPNLVFHLMAIFGGILIFRGFYSMIMIKNKRKSKKIDKSIFNWQKLRNYCNIILFILCIYIYRSILPKLGFLLTTFLFFCICVTSFYFIFTDQKDIKAMNGHFFSLFTRISVTSIAITFFVYFVFFFLAKVPLPRGIFERIIFGG